MFMEIKVLEETRELPDGLHCGRSETAGAVSWKINWKQMCDLETVLERRQWRLIMF